MCAGVRHLRDDGEAAAQVVETDAADVHAVDDDASARRLNHAEQRQRHGRLAGARAAHDAHLRAHKQCNGSITPRCPPTRTQPI